MLYNHQEIVEYMETHPAYDYAKKVVDGEYESGRYVIQTCENFINDLYDEESEYFLDIDEIDLIGDLLRLINFGSGFLAGKPIYDGLSGFQWFFLISILGWKHKDDPEKRRYEKAVLLIARKSGKSFLVGLIFILLLLIEPDHSEFYSVAPDKELSGQVKKEQQKILASSPAIERYFKITRETVECTLTNSTFTPLAYSENRMDGRHVNVYCADEVGALPTRYPIDAMESGQLNMKNRTGIIISTAYKSLDNPMTEEVKYAKEVLDGVRDDDRLFSLLYEPDNKEDWLSDKTLLQANPLCYDVEENFNKLKDDREQALAFGGEKKSTFLTKHLNIFIDDDMANSYILTKDLVRCRIGKEDFDWFGRDVYVGVDLSQTTDNTAVSMITYLPETDEYVAKSWAFLPSFNVKEKSAKERINYVQEQENGNCFIVGENVVDYQFVEDWVIDLPNRYGVNIIGIGYDRYNAISSAQKWESAGFSVFEIKQHSMTLHAPTKLMKEKILTEKFKYTANRLLELNFGNARVVYDNNKNIYVNKKKSEGRVDMVISLILAMFLWNFEHTENRSVYEDRGILVL